MGQKSTRDSPVLSWQFSVVNNVPHPKIYRMRVRLLQQQLNFLNVPVNRKDTAVLHFHLVSSEGIAHCLH